MLDGNINIMRKTVENRVMRGGRGILWDNVFYMAKLAVTHQRSHTS